MPSHSSSASGPAAPRIGTSLRACILALQQQLSSASRRMRSSRVLPSHSSSASRRLVLRRWSCADPLSHRRSSRFMPSRSARFFITWGRLSCSVLRLSSASRRTRRLAPTGARTGTSLRAGSIWSTWGRAGPLSHTRSPLSLSNAGSGRTHTQLVTRAAGPSTRATSTRRIYEHGGGACMITLATWVPSSS